MAVDLAAMTGQAAVYAVHGSGTGFNVIRELMLIFIGINPSGPDAGQWLQMQVTKMDGATITATVLVDDPRLSPERAKRTHVLRYIYQEHDDQPIEYVDAVRGGAVTTVFGLLENFFPNFAEDDLATELFPRRGRFLGLPIERVRTLHSDARVPESPLRLELDPELLIGTGHNARDTNHGRIWTGDDYTYRQLEADDYDELIAAGVNYFIVNDEQEQIIRNRPVFYLVSRWPRRLEYPEMFYRANCRGTTMFMDEPGVHIVCFVRELPGYTATLKQPKQIARLLEDRVREIYDSDYSYGRNRLQHMLRMAPFDLGTMDLRETHYPVWETEEWSVYYELESGPPGAVHEGRYVFGNEPQATNAEFDARIPCRPESIFLQTYAFFRGAARVFDGDWGTAIYGQCERDIAPLAMTMAYDMGARYVWFWTSDRLHHMPYEEQLALTKQLREHAAAHPRPPMDHIRSGAQVAIALPDGYTLRPFRLWDTEYFHLDRVNEHGVSYRQVLHNAALQIERCVKEDIPFDLVYADDAFAARASRYPSVIYIREDGSVEGKRSDGSAFDVPPPSGEPAEQGEPPPTLTVRIDPIEGDAPLTVHATAEVESHSGPAGLKIRKPGTADWTYREVVWIIEMAPTEAGRQYSQSGETIPITFEKPGEYRIGAWTCDDRGVATRKWTTVRVR